MSSHSTAPRRLTNRSFSGSKALAENPDRYLAYHLNLLATICPLSLVTDTTAENSLLHGSSCRVLRTAPLITPAVVNRIKHLSPEKLEVRIPNPPLILVANGWLAHPI